MLRVPIQSRLGNLVVGILGVVYFLAAGSTLIYYAVSNWGANSLVDLVFQGALFIAAAVSLMFIAIATSNLVLTRPGRSPQTSPTLSEQARS